MAKFQVSFAAMRLAIAELRACNEQFQQAVTALLGEQEELSAQWQGQAHDAFNAAFEADRDQWDIFCTLIEMYASTLEEILQQYEDAESRNVSLAAGRTYGTPATLLASGGTVFFKKPIMVLYAAPRPRISVDTIRDFFLEGQ